MTHSQASMPARREAPEPVHPCIRCGRPVADPAAGLCEQCNPLELAQPASTQMHGIAAVGIIAFVAVLAVLGRVALAGSGPFDASVLGVAAAPGGLAVTLVVENQGTSSSATTCRLTEVPARFDGLAEIIQVPQVPAGGSTQVVATLTKFGTTPVGLAATCGTR